MNPVEQYLSDMGAIRSTGAGTVETSYYTALSTLLNEIGKKPSPKVRCVIQLQNKGAGMPDGGMFTADQFRGKAAKEDAGANPLKTLPPSRGVIEVKSPAEDMADIIESEQIARYWDHYGLVLVTNYRAFTLIGRTATGHAVELESFTLAATEAEFWKLAAHPRTCPAALRERFAEYLYRAMTHNAPLASPQDVAAILASYARDAKARIEHADLPALAGLREALEHALGLKFEGDKGEHFFRSTLIQTLFYGIFSAWVLWARKRKPAPAASVKEKSLKYALKETAASYRTNAKQFEWRSAVWLLRVPMIRALFGQIATPERLGPLGLEEVLDWAASALNRVDGDAFFTAFDEGHAVQYFYEPFLQEFDPELRKDLGVWYTPTEIVEYQERVDTVLREELHIADGLADPRVIVLDPCCGTGAYVRAVLNRIAKTLDAKGGDALNAQEVKTAALERVFGFEILPAPFVIAHLQIGLLLETLGAPLIESKEPDKKAERVGVYLTNSLTGWEPPKEKPKQLLLMPELEQERDAANNVKQGKKIIVVIGNPPYNGFAGVSPEEENGLVNAYKEGLSDWGITRNYLDDLYVRFFRLAEKRITEHSGLGVVSFISNFSYLSEQSYVIMRRRFLEEFDTLRFDCLNGDSRETGKLTPDGNPDPSVFSTQWNREGIRVGTAIGLMVKHDNRSQSKDKAKVSTEHGTVRFRQFWGTKKREELLASLASSNFDAQYDISSPSLSNRWSFRPSDVSATYLQWSNVVDLSAEKPFLGLNENRGGDLQCIDKDALRAKIQVYLDQNLLWDEYVSPSAALTKPAAGFKPESVRKKVQAEEPFSEDRIQRYLRRPFDTVWAYISDVSPLWNRSRPELRTHLAGSQKCFITRPSCPANPEGIPVHMTRLAGEQDSIRGHAYYFPVRLKKTQKKKVAMMGVESEEVKPRNAEEKSDESARRVYHKQEVLFDDDVSTANLSPATLYYLPGTSGWDAPAEPLLTYELVNGEMTITGVDSFFTGNSLPIPENLAGYPVTSIGDYAFSDCASLTSVNIPSGGYSDNMGWHKTQSHNALYRIKKGSWYGSCRPLVEYRGGVSRKQMLADIEKFSKKGN